jgi:hypothetical protein
MTRILIAVIAALSLGIGGADAASKKKKVRHAAPAPAMSAPMSPYYARTPGPPWANPNDCYTDEGYGRYLRCGGGMDM